MTRSRIAALTSLYLLVVCAVGMLHPVRNALVLGALGGQGFYKVYLASALVALAVALFGRLADQVPHRRLTSAVAVVFAVNLMLFRGLFPGGVVFGVLFYAWHDLYAGILISQYFLATNELLDPRSAKRAYPWIVAAGSVGAAIGGAVTGLVAPVIGLANLLLVAAALTLAFAIALPAVLGKTRASELKPHVRVVADPNRAPVRDVLADRQVQLIAASVVLTVLVKQLVDYQFNAATATLGGREAISEFQGKFNAATQWLPLVAAAAIKPALGRWGVGAALLMLPSGMIVANLLIGLRGGLGSAAIAKGTETTLRYSAERTGREILYLPVPEAIRARAKPMIDVGLESGLAKALSAGLIFALLATVGAAWLAWVAVALSALWLGAAIAARRAYVRALAQAVRAPALKPALLAAAIGNGGAGDGRRMRAGHDAEPAVPTLVSVLRDPAKDLRTRQRAARALRERGGTEAAAALLGAAADGALELELRTSALHALRRLCDEDPATEVEHAAVLDVVTRHLDAAERYASAGAVLHDDSEHDRDHLLQQSVTEAWQTRQAAVFDGIGVIYEPRVVDGCYRALTGSDERRRAEALELIEESASRRMVRRLDPILRAAPDYASSGVAGRRSDVVAALRQDEDEWVALCAKHSDSNRGIEETMEVIDRVYLLQRVDVFADVPSHHLARIALLSRELEADAGAVLLRADEKADAVYIVIDGELSVERPGAPATAVRPGEAIGALAVLDDAPVGVEVRAVRTSRLLCLTRRALHDLLHDHPDLAESLLHGVATRLRWLVEFASRGAAPGSRPARVPPSDRPVEQQQSPRP
jgi:CRP-like cAMP-binding protein/ATP/ADP translocase